MTYHLGGRAGSIRLNYSSLPGRVRHSIFFANLTKTVGASAVSFGITTVTTPVMTRLFSSEAYGASGLLVTTATLVSSLGLLGLPVALAREQTGPAQASLLHASIRLSAIVVLATALVVCALTLLGVKLPRGVSGPALWALPIVVLGYCAQRVCESVVTARGLFSVQANARVASAACARLSTIAIGWLAYPTALIILLGDVAGKVTFIGVISKRHHALSAWRSLFDAPYRMTLRTIVVHRDFAIYSNIATMLPIFSTLGIQSIIAVRLDTSASGQYVLAQSVITLPVSLIVLTSASVVFHFLVQTADRTPDRLPVVALVTMLGGICAGTICMLPVVLFGPQLFAFFFGEPWRSAGAAASWLALPQIFLFSETLIISLFRVTRRIRAWLFFELSGTILVVGGFFLMPKGANVVEDAAQLAILGLCYQLMMHIGCMMAARPRQASR